MLRITDAQCAIFAAEERAAFDTALRRHLRETWPAAVDGLERDGLFEAFIEALRDRAAALGFERRSQIARYGDILCLTGGMLEKDPALAWARVMLEDRAVPAGQRLDLVWRGLRAGVEG